MTYTLREKRFDWMKENNFFFLNQIICSSKQKSIAFVYGQRYNFDLSRKFIWFELIFIWFKYTLFELDRFYLI